MKVLKAKNLIHNKHYFLLVLMLFGFNFLVSCGKPEVNPPTVEPVLSNYFKILQNGDYKQAERVYFMPLHWRQKEKIFKYFNQEHELIKQKALSLKVISVKQKGRWALAVMERSQSGETLINQLWFFYYDGRWQVISPVIFKTGPVRAMMDLYREQNVLWLWFEREGFVRQGFNKEQYRPVSSNGNTLLKSEIKPGTEHK